MTAALKIVLGGEISTIQRHPPALKIENRDRLWSRDSSLLSEAFFAPPNQVDQKIVLGGVTATCDFVPPALKTETSGCGWIEVRLSTRSRKNRDAWQGQQYWLHWEEAGGSKRSRYISKRKLAEVEDMVYRRKCPLSETLEFLGKTKGGR
jgi:hypothetical protein